MIYEPILFPDAEALLIDVLAEFIDADVSAIVPPDLAAGAEHVAVSRQGGISRDVVVDDATIVFESRAGGRTAAQALIQLVRAHVHALVGSTLDGVAVSRVRDVGGPAWQPDPDTRTPRFVYTASITLRGAAIEGS